MDRNAIFRYLQTAELNVLARIFLPLSSADRLKLWQSVSFEHILYNCPPGVVVALFDLGILTVEMLTHEDIRRMFLSFGHPTRWTLLMHILRSIPRFADFFKGSNVFLNIASADVNDAEADGMWNFVLGKPGMKAQLEALPNREKVLVLLHHAINNRYNQTKYMLDLGVNPNAFTEFGASILCHVLYHHCHEKDPEVLQAVVRTLRLLSEYGADWELEDPYDNRPKDLYFGFGYHQVPGVGAARGTFPPTRVGLKPPKLRRSEEFAARFTGFDSGPLHDFLVELRRFQYVKNQEVIDKFIEPMIEVWLINRSHEEKLELLRRARCFGYDDLVKKLVKQSIRLESLWQDGGWMEVE